VETLFQGAGQPIGVSADRGLDHGAWVPLRFIYPDADIPVCQLSLQHDAGPAWHRDVGRILRQLRDEGVLILASGSVTHNFGWLSGHGSPAYPPAVEFAQWLGQAITDQREADVLAYRDRAPHGAAAHPTEEHLLPLFVAWGAADADDDVTRLTPEYTYGGLAMDVYLWQRNAARG
jgi:4,5-DOPA dioxygenase extradiol